MADRRPCSSPLEARGLEREMPGQMASLKGIARSLSSFLESQQDADQPEIAKSRTQERNFRQGDAVAGAERLKISHNDSRGPEWNQETIPPAGPGRQIRRLFLCLQALADGHWAACGFFFRHFRAVSSHQHAPASRRGFSLTWTAGLVSKASTAALPARSDPCWSARGIAQAHLRLQQALMQKDADERGSPWGARLPPWLGLRYPTLWEAWLFTCEPPTPISILCLAHFWLPVQEYQSFISSYTHFCPSLRVRDSIPFPLASSSFICWP